MARISDNCLVSLASLLAIVVAVAQCKETGATYNWKTEEYSACSQTCNGQQVRRVSCQGKRRNGSLFDAATENCESDNSQQKPITTRPCGNDCEKYVWIKGKYGNCECLPHGIGNRTRRVWCEKRNGTHKIVAKDEDCVTAQKPKTEKSCHAKCGKIIPGTCRFQVGIFGPCTQTCIGGTQTRSVHCLCNYTNGKFRMVHGIKLCLQDNLRSIPIEKRPCGAICPSWYVGKWGNCSSADEERIRTRQVACMRGTNRIDESKCLPTGRKPRTKESCDRLVPPRIVTSSFKELPNFNNTYYIGDNVSVFVGTDVRIICTLEEDVSPADITWLIPGNRRLRAGARSGRTSTSGDSPIASVLLIELANKQNNGNYTCIAKNTAGEAQATSSLVVRHILKESHNCIDIAPTHYCEQLKPTVSCDKTFAEICCKSCKEH